MSRPGTVITGRSTSRGARCPSCDARQKLGEPKTNDTWPSRLTLTAEQINLLLVAAAEYRDLCAEAGEYEEAVEFVDWLSVDAMRHVYQNGGVSYPEFDGISVKEAPNRTNGPGAARHGAPDPIPYAPVRRLAG